MNNSGPYYFIAKSNYLIKRIPLIMLSAFLIQLLVYFFFYDKTYYHIDAVREPMIRFLFFQSMLMGLYFRANHVKYVNVKKLSNWIFLMISILAYFVTKLVFVKINQVSQFQIFNQVILFFTLYYVFKCFASVDEQLVRLPQILKIPIGFLAKITLQIYAVQYVIIPRFANLIFPLNWLVITTLIIILAYALYIVGTRISDSLQKLVDGIIHKINKKEVA